LADKSRIDNLRAANDRERLAGLLGGATQAVAGGFGLANADLSPASVAGRQADGWTRVGTAGGDFVSKLVESWAEDARIRAAEHESLAEAHGADVDAMRSGEDRLERLMDRAMSHLSEVAQARLDARLTSAR